MKKEHWMLEFQDVNHKMICKMALNEMMLTENFVIHESIEKFGTNDPCIIYRTTILNDKIFECKEYIQELYRNGIQIVHKKDIPYTVFNGMEGTEEFEYVKIHIGERKGHEKKHLFRA